MPAGAVTTGSGNRLSSAMVSGPARCDAAGRVRAVKNYSSVPFILVPFILLILFPDREIDALYSDHLEVGRAIHLHGQ